MLPSYHGWIHMAADGNFFLGQRENDLIFRTGAAEDAIIIGNGGGQTGVFMQGDVAPNAALYILGNRVGFGVMPMNSNYALSTGALLVSGLVSLTDADGSNVTHIENTGAALQFDVGGNATLAVTQSNCSVNGYVECSGYIDALAFNVTSDLRYKSDVATAAAAANFEDVMRLRVVDYRWTASDPVGMRRIGLVAQEVADVRPGLVANGGDHYTIDLTQLTCTAISAVQHMAARLRALEEAVYKNTRV